MTHHNPESAERSDIMNNEGTMKNSNAYADTDYYSVYIRNKLVYFNII